jgi:uncharacterized membrane protein YkoI
VRGKFGVIAAIVAGAAVAAGVGIAATRGGDGDSLTGSTLEKASAAALRHTGGGSVTETEVGDDGAAYGVEVRLEDGREVEVSLDQDFHVISTEADDDGGERDEDEPTE